MKRREKEKNQIQVQRKNWREKLQATISPVHVTSKQDIIMALSEDQRHSAEFLIFILSPAKLSA